MDSITIKIKMGQKHLNFLSGFPNHISSCLLCNSYKIISKIPEIGPTFKAFLWFPPFYPKLLQCSLVAQWLVPYPSSYTSQKTRSHPWHYSFIMKPCYFYCLSSSGICPLLSITMVPFWCSPPSSLTWTMVITSEPHPLLPSSVPCTAARKILLKNKSSYFPPLKNKMPIRLNSFLSLSQPWHA